MDRKLLSIIIPCYNEEKTVETIYATVTDVMTNGQCDYEKLYDLRIIQNRKCVDWHRKIDM